MPELKRRLRGEYENRIVKESEMEKVFETFASVRADGNVEMTLYDLLNSFNPYNYTTKSAEELKEIAEEMKEDCIFWIFDVNNSKTISFDEYLALLTIKRMSKNETKAFFTDGKITQENFFVFFKHIKTKYHLCLTENNGLLDSRLIKVNKKFIQESEKKFCKTVFKEREVIDVKELLDIIDEVDRAVNYFEVG